MKNTKTILLPRMPVDALLRISKRHRVSRNRKKQEQIKACKNFKNKKSLLEMEGTDNVGV